MYTIRSTTHSPEKNREDIGGYMDNKRIWTKVYLEEEVADKICLLGGGNSYDYLDDGIKTALNMAVASMQLHSPLDQQHGRRSRGFGETDSD